MYIFALFKYAFVWVFGVGGDIVRGETIISDGMSPRGHYSQPVIIRDSYRLVLVPRKDRLFQFVH